MPYCPLQHRNLLSLPGTSTTVHFFCCGPASSFLLQLFFCSSPLIYCTPTDLGGVYLSESFLFPFHYCPWNSQGKKTDVVCHPLLQWTTFYQNSSVVCLGWPYMAYSFIELHKAMIHVVILVSFLCYGFHLSCPQMDDDKRMCKLPHGRDWLWGKLGLTLVGRAMLNISLIQFSADGAAVLPPCNLASGDPVLEFCSLYARAIVSMLHLMLTSSNRTHPNTLYLLGILLLVPLTLQQALLTHAFTECSQTLTGKSDSVSYRVTAPFSWFLVHTRFCFCPPSVSVSPVL